MDFAKLLEQFHNAILCNNADIILSAIKSNHKITPAQQLRIYIDGYRIRLLQVIRSDYPVLLSLLGEDVFYSIALEYIENNPPTSFNLDRYPHQFGQFFTTKNKDVFVCDLARLESAIAEVFMGEESEIITAEEFYGISAEEFSSQIFHSRKASRLMKFSSDVNSWLNDFRNSEILITPENQNTYIYIYRHKNTVQRMQLSQEAYMLLYKIFSGISLDSALEYIINEHPEYEEFIYNNLQGWFMEWVSAGVFGKVDFK